MSATRLPRRRASPLRRPAVTRRTAVTLLIATAAGGCVSIGDTRDARAYVVLQLQDPGAAALVPRQAPLVDTLLVDAGAGDALASMTSIAYASQPHVFGFYQFASWTERPTARLTDLLLHRLQARRVAGAVGRVGGPLRGDRLLTLRIHTFHHDAVQLPGRARLALTAELDNRRTGQRLAQRTFAADVPAQQGSAAGYAAAMSTAVGTVFDALLPWLEAALQGSGAQPA